MWLHSNRTPIALKAYHITVRPAVDHLISLITSHHSEIMDLCSWPLMVIIMTPSIPPPGSTYESCTRTVCVAGTGRKQTLV